MEDNSTTVLLSSNVKLLSNCLSVMSTKDKPYGHPLITGSYLRNYDHINIIPCAELLFTYACIFNEAHLVQYLIERYTFDPNTFYDNLRYSAYSFCCINGCYETIFVLLKNGIFPSNWYLLFLSFINYGYWELFEYIILTYPQKIHLPDINRYKLLDKIPNSRKCPIIREFLRTGGTSPSPSPPPCR